MDPSNQQQGMGAPSQDAGTAGQEQNQDREVGGQGGAQGSGMQARAGGGVAQGEQRRKSEQGVLIPPVDVIEDEGGITLVADMPGVSKDNLNLRLEAQSLTIEGALSLNAPQDMMSRYAEVRSQHYERTFALSKELDGEQATAQLAHGVLKVRIPKAQHAVPRKIQVNVA